MNKWYVCYINQPRKIKLLPGALKSVTRESKVWMPTSLVKKKKINHSTKIDEWVEVEKPIYPHYIFINFSEDLMLEVETAVKTQCQGRLLKILDKYLPEALRNDEMSSVEEVVAEQQKNMPVELDYDLNIGQVIELPSGLKGVIKELLQTRAKVEVTFLGRSTTITVEVDQCRPLSK